MKITDWMQVLMTAVLLCAARPTQAQSDLRFDQTYVEGIAERSNVTALKTDAFGDRISLQSGAVDFQWLDIDIPGSSNLPVRLQRSLVIEDKLHTAQFPGFGEFGVVDVPYLKGVFSTAGWQVAGPSPNNRCSSFGPPPSYSPILFQDYWSGNSMHIPWVGNQMLLKVTPGAVTPPSGTAPIITKDFWAFRCTPTTNGYAGEGFVGLSPSGDKYYFTHAVTKSHAGLSKRYANYGSGTANMARRAVYLLLTKMEDRFGNAVTYTYANDRLSRIQGSDGRFIQVDTWSGDKITRISSSAGIWNYSYSGRTMTVTRPDGSAWKYAATGALAVHPVPDLPLYDGMEGPGGPNCPSPEVSTGDYGLTVTHPAGASATFTFGVRRHGFSNVPKLCNSFIDNTLMSYKYLTIPNFSDSLTLLSKQVTGPGLSTMTWQYQYRTGGGPFSFEDICANPPSEIACPQTSTTDVYGPEDSFHRYTFGNLYKVNFGQLLKEEIGSVGSGGAISILRTLDWEYSSETEADSAAFASQLGAIGNSRIDDIGSAKLRPVKQRVITQEQKTYRTEYSAFDIFARPTRVKRTRD